MPEERDRIKTLFEASKKRGSAGAQKREITSQMTSLEGTRENLEELPTFQGDKFTILHVNRSELTEDICIGNFLSQKEWREKEFDGERDK